MASFGHFILADPTSRGPLLHSLEIRVAVVSDAALDIFLRALGYTVNLARLRLSSLEELPRATAKTLCIGLAALKSVTDFALRYPGGDYDRRLRRDPECTREEYFPGLIRRLQSSLVSVTLVLPPEYDNEACVIYKRNRDPIYLLSTQSASLEHVALRGNITVGGSKCIYSRVTRLSLPSDMGLLLLQPYIACFPNVSTVDFLYNGIYRYPQDMTILDMWRVGLSLKEWHNVNTRNQVASGTWSRIQSLQGTIQDVYVYGISCHTTRLHLLSIGGDHSDELVMLSAILALTMPTALRLAVKVWSGRASLPMLPSTPASERLTSLELRINIILQKFQLDAYIDHVTNMLGSMRVLKSFQLELRCLNTEIRSEVGLANNSSTSPINGTGINCATPLDGVYGRCYLRDIMGHVDLYQMGRGKKQCNRFIQIHALSESFSTSRRVPDV
ncbi:hypothetical protein K466DRAFT_653311 [Polyporus arcularius HHB13444]|uniref:Uncharacterized protein n=1 Tax=Polyporus arcularius HHB13444 TaxID=1314778 RepID=A0A5C3PBP1_9APHY|nr:hypothetical protein K466DRAFT_653311 [Polyporus arcularius HHB13444]